jgi:serine/threonine-protein kinase HipA
VAKSRGWELSPAFDLTPTPMTAMERRDLAMACGDRGRHANKNNLLSQHGRFLLEREDATTILNKIVETVNSSWRPVMKESGVSNIDCKMIETAFLYKGFFY